ncbi:MAG: SBBP repeat-containing protein [Pirellulaceae bacterium]|nr:SBBP repeat-containing protein [Pirellulaceae bacterium]
MSAFFLLSMLHQPRCSAKDDTTNNSDSRRTIEWVKQEGGSKHDKIRGITVDAVGNCYVTGEFTDEARFGDRAVTSRGSMDFVLAKYSPDGELMWLQTAGGSEIDRGYSVAVDAVGNSYVTGHFQSPEFHIGDRTFTNRGDYDYFVAKFDVDGNFQWAHDGGGKGYDYGHGIAVTPTGDAYVTGSFSGAVTLGEATSPSAKGKSVFVVMYDTDGQLKWSRLAGNDQGQSGHNIAVGPGGDCYVSGYVSGVVQLSGHEFGSPTSVKDIFVARLTADGEFIWARTAGGESDGLSTGVAVDGQGNCYLTGMFTSKAVFGTATLVSAGEYDVFVARFDADGKPAWAYSGGGEKIDYGLGVATDSFGNCYVTGEFTDDVRFMGQHLSGLGGRDLYVARYSPHGELDWLEVMGGAHSDLSYAVTVDGGGSCFLSGAFSPGTQYRSHKLTSRGSNDIFLIKLKQE